MKKIALAGIIPLLIFACACESEKAAGGLFSTDMGGGYTPASWNMLLQSMPEMEKYYLEVGTTGGSGVAVISATRKIGSSQTSLGSFTVGAASIPLTANGPSVQFSDSGGTFSLAQGDQWVLMYDAGQLLGVFPVSVAAGSTHVKVTSVSGPTQPICSYGLFKAFPGATMPTPMGSFQFSFEPMRVNSSSSQTMAEAPETSLLIFQTLNPMLVLPGNTVGISYDRSATLDGAGGDYFEVVAFNDRSRQTLEFVAGSSGPATVTKSFTATGNFAGFEFISGLSGPTDSVKLDNFQFRVNGVEKFSADFESVSPPVATADFMLIAANPATMLGSAAVCSTAPLAGLKSYCVLGGRAWSLYGQGASGGLLFNMADGSIGSSYFLGAFMGMVQDSVMIGTYSGHNYDKSCNESGAFVTLINPQTTASLAGTWDLSVQGQLKNCEDPADELSPLAFTVSSLPVMQIGTVFGGGLMPTGPVTDSLSNPLDFFGFVNGNSLTVMLNVKNPPTGIFYRLSLSGLAGNNASSGMAMGWAAKNPLLLYKSCDFEGMFNLAVTPSP